MVERRYVSSAQVAAALGVGPSTVKRWVDGGVLPAQRTAGGHRRILVDDVLRVARAGNFPRLDVTRLGLPRRGAAAPVAGELADQLTAALRAGDGPRARVLVESACRGGLSPEELADEVVAPAMAAIGHGWEQGNLDVLHEHRATQACAAALYGVKAGLEQGVGGGRPVAVGGGPEGDPYLLANLLVELVLLAAGWEVVNLGPHTPLASFRKAVAEFRPRLVWVSVSYLAEPAEFARQYAELYRAAVRAGAAVAVGGRGLSEEMRAGLPYTTHGDRMAHLAAFARSLRSGGRPRRA